jgi:hypothetical protein
MDRDQSLVNEEWANSFKKKKLSSAAALSPDAGSNTP